MGAAAGGGAEVWGLAVGTGGTGGNGCVALVGRVVVGAGSSGDDGGRLWWEVVVGAVVAMVLGAWLWSGNRVGCCW